MPKFSIFILLSIVFLTYFMQFFYTVNALELNSNAILMPPSVEHFFGTDRLGRDIFSRVIVGGQTSLIIGISSAFIASFIGFIVGAMAGYFKGYFDKTTLVIIDIFLTFPTFFLLLALSSYLSASSLVLILIISLTSWMSIARLVRAESFKIKTQAYMKILTIAKVSKFKILLKYYAPSLAPIYFVSFTFGVGGAILGESALSFLGLGITAPLMSWGTILSSAKDVLEIAWWVSFFPAFMIFLVTFSLVNISNYLQNITNKKEIQN